MCGFVGVVGARDMAAEVVLGLQALQHRGQDAAGVGTFDGDRFHLHKELGLVTAAIPPAVFSKMPGQLALGHVRYPTAGSGGKRDAQPFWTRRGIMMAHNGNVTNVPELEAALRSRGYYVMSQCDVEPILMVLADELGEAAAVPSFDELADAVGRLMQRVRGAYSVVSIMEVDTGPALVVFRDPHGIRPLVMGTRDDGSWMVASESVALDVVGYPQHQFLAPGSVAVLRQGHPAQIREVGKLAARPCIFEKIYFGRADTVTEDGLINGIRWRLGEQLAAEWKARGLEADVAVAVPDTSRPAAMALAETLGLANREGFIKNRYSGRTFIMPDQAMRDAALRLKLNPIRAVFENKRVVLVDDSIVRGTTMGRIVRTVRALDPKEVHVAIFSPPVRHPCFYGIDMPSTDELVAAQHPQDVLQEELAKKLGADSVTFLSIDGMRQVVGSDMCAACFDGDYIVPLRPEERQFILGDRRAGA